MSKQQAQQSKRPQKTTSEATIFEDGAIEVRGAKVHNLKNIDVDIPRHKLTVITGLSGSGKSTLAFDTLFAEGQRRYMDTFSPYARGFIGGGQGERPNVDSIEGLSPVVAIDQKTVGKNPRSTVGTITEISDFLRVLFARAATPYSYLSGKEMVRYTRDQVVELIQNKYQGKAIEILAPVVIDRKGHYRELFAHLMRKGYVSVCVDGVMQALAPNMVVNRFYKHYISVLIDKCVVKEENAQRLLETVTLAFKEGDGLVDIRNRETSEIEHLSHRLMDPDHGISYPDPSPADFSFNTPRGYCPRCRGLGEVHDIDIKKVIPNGQLSIKDGGIVPIGKAKKNQLFVEIERILAQNELTLSTPIDEIPEEVLSDILWGEDEVADGVQDSSFKGIASYLVTLQEDEGLSAEMKKWIEPFLALKTCPDCKGSRLNSIARSYRLGTYNIADLSQMDIEELHQKIDLLPEALQEHQRTIALEILKEVKTRLCFLVDVGLGYLSLSRSSASISGGEAQRIRLATQIGTGLVEVLYILDEPGIGLHQRDNRKLIQSLHQLRDAENTIVVVEHDRDMMLASDYIVDMGPGAGRMGGKVVFAGTPQEILSQNSLTASYLNLQKCIPLPASYRSLGDKRLVLKGAKGNNLKNVSVEIPLGVFVCITGVSGSGKSTLINDTLVPIISKHLYRSLRQPLEYEKIEGLEHIDKLSVVDQSPLGRTPRSNPATYTGLFTEIRNLFAMVPESKARGYKPSRFSFNVKGGRCETCKGNGEKVISMNFLPNVHIPCEVCQGKRYTRDTLEVRYKGKSIADVLDMTINQATEFFEAVPSIYKKLHILQRVGLGYIKLGQPSTTLSGGENQRVKLSSELSKRDTGNTLYILDEPTTGLHFEDILMLLGLINELVDRGNSVWIIEHNLDVIKSADYLIDMGPDGGRNGGEVVFAGTPLDMVRSKPSRSYTASYLEEEIERTPQPSATQKS